MLSKDPNYVRIPTGGRTLSGHSSYWLAADHLLLVEVQFAVESYRRFALKDITGLVVRGSRIYGIGIAIGAFATLASAAAVFGLMNSGETQGALVSGIVLLFPSVVGTLVNLVRGPTAYCELMTAVQTLRLPGISRRKEIDRLIQAISTAVSSLERTASQAQPEPIPAILEPTATATPTPDTGSEPPPDSVP
jgi:hypothetical protein